MKLLLVVLPLCFVFVVKGYDDPCNRGDDAISLFMELGDCEPDIWELGEDIMGPFFDNATLHNFRNAVSGYCSVVFPAIRDCFSPKIQHCPDDQRAVLVRVMEDTGFLCQPNSASVHPHFAHLLTHFSDADFEDDDDCRMDDFEHSVRENCSFEALAAMGFASFDEFREFLRDATVEQLMPYVPIYINTLLECGVTMARDMPDRCGNWRGLAIQRLRWQLFPTVLGNTMTFTRDQLDEIFEFQDIEPPSESGQESGQESSQESGQESGQSGQPGLPYLSITLFKRP